MNATESNVYMATSNALTAALARAEAAERRVAELEARLAEQEWRPVTEPPQQEGMYLICRGDDVGMLGYYSYYEDDTGPAWRDEFDDLQDDVTHWRPLPPPPAATE